MCRFRDMSRPHGLPEETRRQQGRVEVTVIFLKAKELNDAEVNSKSDS